MDHDHDHIPDSLPDPLPDQMSRLRAYADGELNEERATKLAAEIARDPELAAQLHFEQALRSKVGAVLDPVEVPGDLEARIRSALRSAEPAPDAPPVLAPDEEASRWWVGPNKANLLAVAASLVLVAGAVLFGILGRPIDSLPGTGVQRASDVARVFSADHYRVASQQLIPGTQGQDRATAALELRRVLGNDVTVPPLAMHGYEFAGFDEVAVADGVDAYRIMYASTQRGEDGCPRGVVSLFAMAADRVDVDRDESWLWRLVADRPDCKHTVLQATKGGIAYFLVTCDESRLSRLSKVIAEPSAD